MMPSRKFVALGLSDRVSQLFIQGNCREVTSFCRFILSQAHFYHVPAENLSNYVKEEILWQEHCHKEYEKVLSGKRIALETEINLESGCFDF